jgi:MFS transporter, DHA3 family, macrolide efflux protein
VTAPEEQDEQREQDAAAHREPLPAACWILLASQGISLAGNGIQQIALPLWVLRETGSALSSGITFAMQFLPIVLLAPWVGHVADRYERRALMIGCELVAAVAVVGLLGAVHIRSVLAVCVLTALTHALNAVTMPAMQAIIISSVPADSRRRSAALTESMQAGVTITAPLLGTLIAGTWGIAAALWVNLGSFVVSAALLVGLRRYPGEAGLRGAVRSSWRVAGRIAADRRLAATMLTEAAYFLLFGADIALVLFIARDRVGDSLAGVCGAGTGAGWLAASVLLGRRGTTRPLRLLRLAGLACPLATGVFLALDRYGSVGLFAACACLGAVNLAVVSAATTVFQQRVRQEEAGRTFAARRALLNAALCLSYLLLPGVAQLGPGNSTTLLLAASLTAVAVFGGGWLADQPIRGRAATRGPAAAQEA